MNFVLTTMRHCAATLLIVGLVTAASPARDEFDWTQWRDLAVQHGGRQKPLDTLARETLRTIANRATLEDPSSREVLDPVATYLIMLFDWQGWDHKDRNRLELATDWRPEYFHLHQADKWDRAPLLRVDYLELRSILKMEPDQKYISAEKLAEASINDPRSRRGIPFSTWAEKLIQFKKESQLTDLEQKAVDLANHYWSYQNHRMGRTLEVLPIRGSETHEWMPLAHLLLARFDDTTDATGDLRRAQQLLLQVRSAYQQNDARSFNQASREFLTNLTKAGARSGVYPSQSKLALEVTYNHWVPFRFAWVFVLISFITLLVHAGTRWRLFYGAAMLAYMASFIAMLVGFGMRIAIAGRPPVTNMYESVIYVGFGVALFGLIFELIYPRKFMLAAATAVCTITLILADNSPTVLDSSVRPLEPVLRSNFWLVTHVMTIALSYAAFALALGVSNITLGYYLVGSTDNEAIEALSRLTYKTIQLGVWLLASGVILGGVWADYSWGRFWGWDPKEVWALIALLSYLAVLHARFAGLVGQRGLAALSVICFSLVIMAWYGVNFVLGAGLHSYGFGGGGQLYVYCAIVLQWLYAAAAVGRSAPTPALA